MRSSYKETIPNGRSYTMVSTKLLTVALALLCSIGLSTNALAQCPLVCNNGVNVSLPGPDQGCAVTLTPDMLLEDPGSCPNGVFAITVMNLQGQPIPTGSTIGAEYIGQTLMYSVLDTNSGNSCWGTMDIEDKLAPTIADCGPVSMSCMMNTDPTMDGGDAPTPTISDCSDGNMSISWFDDLQDIACDDPNMPGTSAIITRTWIAADAQGNQSTCEQIITVMRASLDDYAPTCAPNVTVSCTGSGAGNTTPADTGYPTINVDGQDMDLIPGSEGMCEMATSFSDETFDLCGGGYKILRTWTVYDFCSAAAGNTNNPFTCIQTIEVVDDVAPTMTCPPNITQSTVSSGCNSTIVLPDASTADNCSSVDVVIMTPNGMMEPGDFLTLEPGDTELIYIATDACGNTTSCPMMCTIIDTTPPTTVCDEHTVVALTTAGEAVVSASVFDDGSSDNCGGVTFEVRRMASACSGATDFDAFASFSCCDVGETIMVVLRVRDENGNSNQCMVEVEVQDEIGPSISCPPLKVIECGDSYADLSLFGQPTVEDNCEDPTVEETVVYNISSCGVGTIVRTFTATDAGGMSASCSQTIKIENNDPFELADIIWPTDYETEECGGSLAPDDLPTSPVNHREPIIVEDNCDLVAVTYTDQVLPVNAPACLKVLRTWIVIDWCQYDPNDPNSGGYWSHVQVLIVADHENPVLTCTDDIVIESLEPDCGSSYIEIPAFTATDCSPTLNYSYEIDFNNDGSTDAFGNTADASGNYPMGVSKVTVTVEDGCGNQAFCSFLVSVSDAKKPSPICVNGLAVDLMELPNGGGGMIELTAAMFDYGSFDNCTAQEDLIIEIFPSVFTCDHVGTQQVTMVVTDEAGNSDFCETYVIIQDNMNICPTTSGVMVSGAIQTEMGEGVEQTSVALSASGTPSNSNDMTAEDGVFMFEELAENYDYSITPANNTNIANGVTTWDIVLITKHILGVELLDSPYKIIAADVNNNGSVTTADLIDLRKSVLLLITEFGNNESWRFVDADYVFPEPTNPFAENFPEVINENNLTNNAMFSDFVAVKVGDVNGSAQANAGMTNSQSRSTDILQITTENQELIAGNIYDVTLKASDFTAVQGMQFSIEFHPTALNFHEYKANGLTNINDNNFGFTQINDGIINVSWDNVGERFDTKDGLFTISFYAQNTMMLSEALSINSISTKAEAYNAEGESMDINLSFASNNEGFALYQNRPNPFKGSTTIGFDLPTQSEASLTIYDMSGKVLKVIAGDYHEGYNQIQVSQIELGVTGVLYYQLDTPNNTATRKMVIVK